MSGMNNGILSYLIFINIPSLTPLKCQSDTDIMFARKVLILLSSYYLQVYHVSGQSRVQQQPQHTAGEKGSGKIEFVMARPGQHYN